MSRATGLSNNGFDHQQLPTITFKSVSLIFQVLSSLCLVSSIGYETTLLVLSEIKGEKYRFERLIQSLQEIKSCQTKKKSNEKRPSKLPGLVEEQYNLQSSDCVASALAFLNTIVQKPDSVEKRTLLREELDRRGLDAYLEKLVEQKDTLTEKLANQVDVYFRQGKADKDQMCQMENLKRQSLLQL